MLSRFRPIAIAAGLLILSSCADQVVQPTIHGSAAARAVVPVGAPTGIALGLNASDSWAATGVGQVVTTDLTNLRLEAWVKWTGAGPSVQTILYNGNSSLNGWGIILIDGKVTFLAGAVGVSSLAVALPPNEWHLVAAERQTTGDVALYLDGNVSHLTSKVNAIDLTNSRTMVGASVPADPSLVSGGFSGAIDNVRLSHLDGTLIEEWDFENSDGITAIGQNGSVLALHDVTLLPNGGLLDITIDPRHQNRQIEPERGGKIAVAVLASAGFNPATLDPGSVRFGPNHAPALRQNRNDIDHDGDRDRVYHFDLAATGLTCIDTVAALTATIHGVPVSGGGRIQTLAANLPAHSYVARCANPRVVASELSPDDPNVSPFSLNDRGQVAAYSFDDEGNPFIERWENGSWTIAPAIPGQTLSNITPMNARGTIGILASDGQTSSAWTWDAGAPGQLNVHSPIQTFDMINDQGDAAGQTGTGLWLLKNGKTNTFVLPPNTFISSIGLTNNALLGFNAFAGGSSRVGVWNGKKLTYYSGATENATATRMNQRGQISGYASAGAMVWSADGVQNLGDGRALWINESGDVAIARSNGDLFLSRNGRLTQLPGIQAGNGFGGMNDRGEVVSALASDASLTLFQSDGTSISLMDAQLRGMQGFGLSLNNNGLILGAIFKDGTPDYVIWRVTR